MPRRLVVEAQRPEYLLPAYYLLRTNYRTNYLLTTSTYRLVVKTERTIELTLTIAHERAVGRPHSTPGYPSTWQFCYIVSVWTAWERGDSECKKFPSMVPHTSAAAVTWANSITFNGAYTRTARSLTSA